MRKRSVGVIGAGPSGLVSGKVLLKDGFDVTIFDKHKELGGIWCKDGAYADLHTQQVKGFMEYSDFPDSEGKN
jgi:cation diffusion facilitator CzcD-associated flavoprotein CzcO